VRPVIDSLALLLVWVEEEKDPERVVLLELPGGTFFEVAGHAPESVQEKKYARWAKIGMRVRFAQRRL
jgi:hypothetical protein